MAEVDLVRRKRAWEFAHKLITVSRIVPNREGKDMLDVRTEEFCIAMGKSGSAKLDNFLVFYCFQWRCDIYPVYWRE